MSAMCGSVRLKKKEEEGETSCERQEGEGRSSFNKRKEEGETSCERQEGEGRSSFL